MLNISRLNQIPLLVQSGWTPVHRVDIEMRYLRLKSNQYAQVPLEEVFPAAKDIVEALDGIVIKNLHSELGLGSTCTLIEFNFFEYDASVFSELLEIQSQIEKRVLFIGIGYNIIGDWLVDENGVIYFRDIVHHRLHLVSKNIYQFFEQDIYNLTDRKGTHISGE